MKLDLMLFPEGKIPQISTKVEKFDDSLNKTIRAISDMLDTCNAIGLAAIQVGIAKRIIIAKVGNCKIVAVNPEILWTSEETEEMEEGNVSIPDAKVKITRPRRVKIKYQNLSGKEKVLEADGLLSVCLQHEIEQLDGKSILCR